VGQYARDKDAVVAAMLLSELAAEAKAAGKSLHEKLDALFWQYGCHAERQISVTMPGAEGMARMAELMGRFRQAPPEKLGGLSVRSAKDYLSLTEFAPGGAPKPFDGPKGDMVILELARDGAYVAVRPSGTEPKVKYYLFNYEPAEMLGDLDETKRELAVSLDAIAENLKAYSFG
jgi:phosphoglucomutase/phosphomannomutase